MAASILAAMKLLVRTLAVLAVLLGALALGWKPSAGAGRGVAAASGHRAEGASAAKARRHPTVSSIAGLYARAAHQAAPSSKATAIDDDDEYDDDDVVESGILTPERRQTENDATTRGPVAATPQIRLTQLVSSMHPTRRGIRSSGEHRSTTDRPPRV